MHRATHITPTDITTIVPALRFVNHRIDMEKSQTNGPA